MQNGYYFIPSPLEPGPPAIKAIGVHRCVELVGIYLEGRGIASPKSREKDGVAYIVTEFVLIHRFSAILHSLATYYMDVHRL